MAGRMRAKLRVTGVTPHVTESGEKYGEALEFVAVAKSGGYPEDGSDEDNTFAKFSPSARFTLDCRNPALFGQFELNETYYVDFTPAD